MCATLLYIMNEVGLLSWLKHVGYTVLWYQLAVHLQAGTRELCILLHYGILVISTLTVIPILCILPHSHAESHQTSS